MTQNVLSPENCLARAARCEQMAEEAVQEQTRATFLQLARRWRELAEEDDRIGLTLPSEEHDA